MKKILFSVLLCLVSLTAAARDVGMGRYPHKKGRDSAPIPFTLNYGGSHAYEGVRIGEYVWINRNISTPKGDMGNADGRTVTQAQLDTYMSHVGLNAQRRLCLRCR